MSPALNASLVNNEHTCAYFFILQCVSGIGDNLLSSVLVAWEYHKKTAIFCPACNVDMWNNLPTQRNVAFIRKMGVEILGPRVDRLTNGQVAIGCMEYVSIISNT